MNNLVKVYGAKSATGIYVSAKRANDQTIINQIKSQTAIFIVEDTDEDKPRTFWDWLTALFFPTGLPTSPTPTGVVCYEDLPYKRKNLIDTLRPNGDDSKVLTAIRSVITKGGMVAGNAAIMVSFP